MAKSNTQLQEEVKALRKQVADAEAAIEKAKKSGGRTRFSGGLWPNLKRRPGSKDPEWQGGVRLVVPENKHPGDPLWIDISQWEYDPETSPGNYKQNPPDFGVSISPMLADYAAEQEAKYQAAKPR